MKRMKKRMLALAAVLVLAVSMLTGCGGMTEEDAKEYVKATLDASYKADFDAYMKKERDVKHLFCMMDLLMQMVIFI